MYWQDMQSFSICFTRVARSGLDDGLPGLELAGTLGVLDDGERQAVLDRAQRVEVLGLDVHVDAGGGESVNFHDRRPAHRFED